MHRTGRLFSTPFVGHVPYLWRIVWSREVGSPTGALHYLCALATLALPHICGVFFCGFNYLLLCVGCPDDDDDDDDDDEDEDEDEGDGDDEDEEND